MRPGPEGPGYKRGIDYDEQIAREASMRPGPEGPGYTISGDKVVVTDILLQ